MDFIVLVLILEHAIFCQSADVISSPDKESTRPFSSKCCQYSISYGVFLIIVGGD